MASPPDDKRKNAMALKPNNKSKDSKRIPNGSRTKRKNGTNGSVEAPSIAGEQNESILGVSKKSAIKSAILASHHEKQKNEIRRKWVIRILSIAILAFAYFVCRWYLPVNSLSELLKPLKLFQTNQTNSTGDRESRHDFTLDNNLLSSQTNSINGKTMPGADKIIDVSIKDHMDNTGNSANSYNNVNSDNVALEIVDKTVNRRRRMGNPFRFVWKKFKLFLGRIKRPRAIK